MCSIYPHCVHTPTDFEYSGYIMIYFAVLYSTSWTTEERRRFKTGTRRDSYHVEAAEVLTTVSSMCAPLYWTLCVPAESAPASIGAHTVVVVTVVVVTVVVVTVVGPSNPPEAAALALVGIAAAPSSPPPNVVPRTIASTTTAASTLPAMMSLCFVIAGGGPERDAASSNHHHTRQHI